MKSKRTLFELFMILTIVALVIWKFWPVKNAASAPVVAATSIAGVPDNGRALYDASKARASAAGATGTGNDDFATIVKGSPELARLDNKLAQNAAQIKAVTAVVEAPKAKAVDPTAEPNPLTTDEIPPQPYQGPSMLKIMSDPAYYRLDAPTIDDSKGAIFGNVTFALDVPQKFTTTSGKNIFLLASAAPDGKIWLRIDLVIPETDGSVRDYQLVNGQINPGERIVAGPPIGSSSAVPHIELTPRMN